MKFVSFCVLVLILSVLYSCSPVLSQQTCPNKAICKDVGVNCTTSAECRTGLSCIRGACSSYNIGSACTTVAQCFGDVPELTQCVNGFCVMRAGYGDPCSTNTDCSTPLTCSTTTKKCVNTAATGGACTGDAHCAFTDRCKAARCTPIVALGSTCTADVDCDPSSAVCNAGVCTSRASVAINGLCTTTAACRRGNCMYDDDGSAQRCKFFDLPATCQFRSDCVTSFMTNANITLMSRVNCTCATTSNTGGTICSVPINAPSATTTVLEESFVYYDWDGYNMRQWIKARDSCLSSNGCSRTSMLRNDSCVATNCLQIYQEMSAFTCYYNNRRTSSTCQFSPYGCEWISALPRTDTALVVTLVVLFSVASIGVLIVVELVRRKGASE